MPDGCHAINAVSDFKPNKPDGNAYACWIMKPRPSQGNSSKTEPATKTPRDIALEKIIDVSVRSNLQPPNNEPLNDPSMGEVSNLEWTKADYLVIGLAALIGTLLDIGVVRIPQNTKFLDTLQKGSPITVWVKSNSSGLAKLFKPLEKFAKVPFDFAHHPLIAGLHSKAHRLMSPGHDPIFGLFFGVRDLILGQATMIDKMGKVIVINGVAKPAEPLEAFIKFFAHLLSDAFTTMGLPTPLTTALQFVKGTSPFVLRPGGIRVEWHHVARYMYRNGMDMRHLLTQGITPFAVRAVIYGYGLLIAFATTTTDTAPKAIRDKLEDMIAVADAMVMGGNLLKTGVTKNPLAFNQAQAMTTVISLLGLISRKTKRSAKKKTKTKVISELQPVRNVLG